MAVAPTCLPSCCHYLQAPKRIKLFVNRPTIGFGEAADTPGVQVGRGGAAAQALRQQAAGGGGADVGVVQGQSTAADMATVTSAVC